MKVSSLRIRSPQAVLALFALAGSAGTMQAAARLSATPNIVNLSCSATNPGFPVTVLLKALATVTPGTTTYPVTLPSALAMTAVGVSVAPVSGTAITPAMTTASGISYTFTPAANCTAGSRTYTFKSAPTTAGIAADDVAVTVNITKANFLTTATSTVNLVCGGGIAGPAATVVLKATNVVPSGIPTLTPSMAVAPTGVIVALAAGSATAITNAMSSATPSTGVSFTFTPAASCTGFTTNSQAYVFKVATTGAALVDVPVTVVTTLNPPSILLASPITLSCTKTGSVYSNYTGTQSLAVTSSDGSAISYTVNPTTVPGWLTIDVGSLTTPHTHTLGVAGSTCGGFAQGTSNTANVRLVNPPYADKIVPVTLVIAAPSTLTAPSSISLTYTQKSGTPGVADVAVGGTAGLNFSVDTTSFPIWLTVDHDSGITPRSIRFTTTNGAETLPPGPYTKDVHLRVFGQADKIVTANLQLNSPAPKLIVTSSQSSTSWTIGNPVLPTATITVVSSGAAIPYSIATGGSLQPSIAQASGLAIAGIAQPILVTFSQAAFASAQANTQLSGIASVTWGSPAIITVVSFTVNVQSPTATLNSVWPLSLAAASPATTYSLNLTGTGFIQSSDPNVRTHVGIANASGNAYAENAAFTVSVVDSAHIDLSISVPAAGTLSLPFDTTTSAQVLLSVCNPVNGACNTVNPGSTAAFTIGSIPTITTVTSSSAFLQPTNVAPYDIISLFGFNFCPTCTSVAIASPNASMIYPAALSAGSPTPSALKVTFKNHTGNAAAIADTDAPLLFATNNQINLLVPEVVSTVTGQVDMVVTFGTASSVIFPITVAAANPGVFTIGSDGQGDGAILDQTFAIVNMANPAAVRKGADSDFVSIYMSGLGLPAAGVANSAALSGASRAWSADCISTASYLTELGNAMGNTFLTMDGAIVRSSLLSANRFSPCLTNTAGPTSPTVTIGNVAAVVGYAGWVADSVAGLYQVNVQLPSNAAASFDTGDGVTTPGAVKAPVRLPVVVTLGTAHSQPGVMIAVTPRLKVTAPTVTTGKVGDLWPTINTSVIASEGFGTYSYVLTSGVLPLGLAFKGDGSISGVPALGTSGTTSLTVTATDTATPPVSGTVAFPLTVLGGLTMTTTGTSPYAATFSTANAAVTTVTPLGGISSVYTYAITAPATLPAGLAITAGGIVQTSALTPAGNYNVTVQATDATLPIGLVGNVSFAVNVALKIANVVPAAQIVGNPAAVLATVAATNGNTISTIIHYALDTASVTAGFSIGLTSGIVTVGTAPVVSNWPMVVTATDTTVMALGAAGYGTATVSFNVTVNVVPTLVVTAGTSTGISYATGGPITVTAVGGTSPYNYAITGNANLCNFAVATAGTMTVPAETTAATFPITVTVTDSKGLTAFVTFTVTYTAVPAFSVTAPSSGTAIDQVLGGTISLVPVGGIGTYSYAITGNDHGSSISGSVLTVPAGTTSYSITVTATDARLATTSVTFTVSYQLVVTAPAPAATVHILAAGGTIVIAASGGIGNLTYAISAQTSTVSIVGNTLTVPAGTALGTFTITVTVTDTNSTTVTVPFTVVYD